MATMGRYCKAYPIARLRAFPQWTENAGNARVEEEATADGQTPGPRILTEECFLYLQENYTVTDGIFLDENVIFDGVTPEWKAFCEQQLEFAIPVYDEPPPERTETAQQ